MKLSSLLAVLIWALLLGTPWDFFLGLLGWPLDQSFASWPQYGEHTISYAIKLVLFAFSHIGSIKIWFLFIKKSPFLIIQKMRIFLDWNSAFFMWKTPFFAIKFDFYSEKNQILLINFLINWDCTSSFLGIEWTWFYQVHSLKNSIFVEQSRILLVKIMIISWL